MSVSLNNIEFQNVSSLQNQTHGQSSSVSDESKKLFEILKSSVNSKNKKQLDKEFSDIKPDQLRQALDMYFQDLAQQLKLDDANDIMNHLAELVPLEKLQEAVRIKYPTHKDALSTAKNMLQEAKTYLEKSDSNASPSLRVRLSNVIDALVLMLESFIGAFGIADFFKPAENDLQSTNKSNKIMILISYFMTLSSILLPLLGAVYGAAVIGASLIIMCTLSMIYPYIRPMPSFLPKSVNWSKEILQNNLKVVQGRKKYLDEIAQTLIASKKVKTHPMLIGRTGIGKTQLVKALVKAIENGEYPELKGKKVFYFNTADLVNSNENANKVTAILDYLSESMGRHRDNIILVLDEIHLACQPGKRGVLGEQLKTKLDKDYPYVIGITTEEEYYRDIYVNNSAFARRFKRIHIEAPEPAETLEILNNTLMQEAPKAIVDFGAMDYLLKKTTEVFSDRSPQPATSLKILSQCIKRVSESQQSPTEAKIEKLTMQIKMIYSLGAVGQGSNILPYDPQNTVVQNLEDQLHQLEKQLKDESSNIKKLYQSKEQLAQVKLTTFREAIRLAGLTPSNLSSRYKMQLTAFLLQSHFLANALDQHVRKEAEKLGVKMVIGPSLIDEVIKEELENEKKAKEAVEHGRTQIQSRITV